jgi:hypothetical protein
MGWGSSHRPSGNLGFTQDATAGVDVRTDNRYNALNLVAQGCFERDRKKQISRVDPPFAGFDPPDSHALGISVAACT